MATLNDKVKAFIVQGLATYQTPSQIVTAVKNDFGLETSRQQVESYDPTKRAGQSCAKKWKELFEATRKKYQEDFSDIAIANKAYRLNMLCRMAREAEQSKNRPLAASLLEQAAKEMGEVFTNKQKLDHQSSDKSMTPVVNNFNGDAQAASQAYQDIMGGK